MGLDARIPLMAQGMNLEPRSNALMRAAQLQGTQDTNALRQMQMQQMQQAAQQTMMERQAAAQKEAKMAEMLRRMQPVSGTQANGASGVVGPRPEAAAVIGQRPQVDPMQLLQAGFDPKMVEFIMNSPNLGRQEVARTVEVAGANGSPETRQFDKFGQPVGASLPKPVQRQMAQAGGSLVPYNPYTQADPIGVTLTPGQIQSNATTIRGQNMQDGRARERMTFDRQQADIKAKTPGADKPATEGERKAATLLTRLRGSQAQLDAALEKNPGAAKPELLAESARKFPFLGGDVPANVVTSGPRQQVEAAQLDLLDAALTLGTGAAYTREQLIGYQKAYFPQIGDDANTVADKQERLKNVIRAAEIAAGRAEPEAPKFGGGKAGNVTVDY